MSVYTYRQSNVIDEVIFQKSEGGQTRAYIHAAASADPKILYDIICKAAEHGWQATPYSAAGKPMLEVLGFNKPEKLLGLIEQAGWATGERRHLPTVEEKGSFTEQVRKRSLGASGLAYIIGDASFAKYGYADRNPWNFAGGLLYGAGTLSLLGGGRKDPSDLQIKDISKKMAAHFRELDLNLPKDCSLSAITEDHHKGLIKTTDDWFRRYPSEMMNLFFAAAGGCIAIAAYKSLHKPLAGAEFKKEIGQVLKRLSEKATKKGLPVPTEDFVKQKMIVSHKRSSWLDIGLGTMTGLSGLFAMSVKEKARDSDDSPRHGLEAAWEWVRERPLAIAGVGYMISTMCHATSTMIDRQYAGDKHRKSIPWRGTFIVANIIAELLLAISSKGHGEGVKSDGHVDKTVTALAAELIVKQPKGLQEYLIDHMGNFLGRSDVLAVKNAEVKTILRTQVEAMRNNPWAQYVTPETKKEQQNAAPSALEKAWQAKVAAKPAAQPPQLQA